MPSDTTTSPVLSFGARRNTTPTAAKTSAKRQCAITATFTAAEFARLQPLIGDMKPGSWAHDALIAAVDRVPLERYLLTTLAEVLAVRRLLVRGVIRPDAPTTEVGIAELLAETDMQKVGVAAGKLTP